MHRAVITIAVILIVGLLALQYAIGGWLVVLATLAGAAIGNVIVFGLICLSDWLEWR